jgi:hypothetical protein
VSTAEPGPSSVGNGMLAQAEKDRSSRRPRAGADPLARVLTLGGRHNGVGLAIGLAGALFVHGAGAATSLHRLFALEDFAAAIYDDVSTELRGVYDIEVDPPPAPQEAPPPEEETEEVQEESEPLAPTDEAPAPEAPPPEAAEVGEALTAEPDPDAPLDLTGDQWSMVTGPGTRFAGGASHESAKTKEGSVTPGRLGVEHQLEQLRVPRRSRHGSDQRCQGRVGSHGGSRWQATARIRRE